MKSMPVNQKINKQQSFKALKIDLTLNKMENPLFERFFQGYDQDPSKTLIQNLSRWLPDEKRLIKFIALEKNYDYDFSFTVLEQRTKWLKLFPKEKKYIGVIENKIPERFVKSYKKGEIPDKNTLKELQEGSLEIEKNFNKECLNNQAISISKEELQKLQRKTKPSSIDNLKEHFKKVFLQRFNLEGFAELYPNYWSNRFNKFFKGL